MNTDPSPSIALISSSFISSHHTILLVTIVPTPPFLEEILVKSSDPTKKLAHTHALRGYAWKGGVEHKFVNATDIHTRRQDVGQWLFANKNSGGGNGGDNITTWLATGTFVAPPAKVLPGGLGEGIKKGLELISGGIIEVE